VGCYILLFFVTYITKRKTYNRGNVWRGAGCVGSGGPELAEKRQKIQTKVLIFDPPPSKKK